jgi:hypothetical protein
MGHQRGLPLLPCLGQEAAPSNGWNPVSRNAGE